MLIGFTSHRGGSRGLVVKVLDSKFKGCEFKQIVSRRLSFDLCVLAVCGGRSN